MNHPYENLVEELLAAFIQGGKAQPVMPEGRRGDIVIALTRLMADRKLLLQYLQALKRQRRHHGVHSVLMAHSVPDASLGEIIRSGVESLSDAQLAELAVDPTGLARLFRLLDTTPGSDDPFGSVWGVVCGVARRHFESLESGRSAEDLEAEDRRGYAWRLLVSPLPASEPYPPDQPFATALFDAFIGGGMSGPILPEGRRAEYLALLFGLLADRHRFNAYVAFLKEEQERRGVADTLIWSAEMDIADETLAAGAFEGLTDDQLAGLMISRSMLRATQEFLDDPDMKVGSWYFDAILRVEAERPGAAERARRAEEITRGLSDLGLFDG